MLSIAFGIGFILGLILINWTIAHDWWWIIFLLQHGVRIWVTGLETVSRVTDSLRLYLVVTSSPLVWYVTRIILRTNSWRDHPGRTCATTSQVSVRPNLVSGGDQFYTCQTVVWGRLVYTGIVTSDMGGEWGDLLFGSTRHKRGVSRVQWLIALAMKPQWVCTSWRKSWKSFVVIS
jgi:hypothetical protein